jgi:hypothetical protein
MCEIHCIAVDLIYICAALICISWLDIALHSNAEGPGISQYIATLLLIKASMEQSSLRFRTKNIQILTDGCLELRDKEIENFACLICYFHFLYLRAWPFRNLYTTASHPTE